MEFLIVTYRWEIILKDTFSYYQQWTPIKFIVVNEDNDKWGIFLNNHEEDFNEQVKTKIISKTKKYLAYAHSKSSTIISYNS